MTSLVGRSRTRAAAFEFGAFVTFVAFAGSGYSPAAFALGDGTIRLAHFGDPPGGARRAAAHSGAILAMTALGDGSGFCTGGDDGRLVVVTTAGEAREIGAFGRHWVEHVAEAGGKIACAAGREIVLLNINGHEIARLSHASTIQGVAIGRNQKRLAASHYGGVTLWWVDGAGQARTLQWKGAHTLVTFSPDNRFVVSAMQENALHGWRLSDSAHFRMTDYETKIKSFSWTRGGRYLATSGAQRVLCWPFMHKDGPMGRAPLEVGDPTGDLVKCVSAHPTVDAIAAGYESGCVVLHFLDIDLSMPIATDCGSAVSALAWSADGNSLGFGTESGHAVLIDLSGVVEPFSRGTFRQSRRGNPA